MKYVTLIVAIMLVSACASTQEGRDAKADREYEAGILFEAYSAQCQGTLVIKGQFSRLKRPYTLAEVRGAKCSTPGDF